MTKKLFVDTDIALDLLAKREPFYDSAARLFTLADQQKIKIYVSAASFGNLNYILSKYKTATEARKILSRFKVLVKVLPVDDKIVDLALHSDFSDLEDAIQYHCALSHGMNILLTRNLKDFKRAKIPVMTADGFLAGVRRGKLSLIHR